MVATRDRREKVLSTLPRHQARTVLVDKAIATVKKNRADIDGLLMGA